jgi:uncharacterized membrane protein HdeD (DUF308 family)
MQEIQIANEMKPSIEYWISIVFGIAIIIAGALAKSMLNDSEMAITEEERAHPEPTPLGRISAVVLGICMILYGGYHLILP